MKSLTVILTLFMLSRLSVVAQVGINTDSSTPELSAGLNVKFRNNGVLMPRMTYAPQNAIAVPAEGLAVIWSAYPLFTIIMALQA